LKLHEPLPTLIHVVENSTSPFNSSMFAIKFHLI